MPSEDPQHEITFQPEGTDVVALPAQEAIPLAVDETNVSETKLKASRFVDLVKGGSTPGEAARAVGTTLKKIKDVGEFRNEITRLVGNFELAPEIRKRMVDAGLNKLYIESVGSDDIEDRKLALAVAKQIGQQDGFAPVEGGVTINFGELSSVLDNITPLEGLEKP